VKDNSEHTCVWNGSRYGFGDGSDESFCSIIIRKLVEICTLPKEDTATSGYFCTGGS
jgi:hypothetical protein